MNYFFEQRKSLKRCAELAIALIVLCVFGTAIAAIPENVIYEGQLFDTSQNPVTSALDIRFSLWNTSDLQPSDIDISGNINALATSYADWTEVHAVQPAFNGSFSVELGGTTPLPAIDSINQRFVQIEVKTSGQPNTAYELLDPTSDNGADTDDRQTIGSVFYAKNAEKLAEKSIGTAQDDIALLGTSGKWDPSQIPGAVEEDFVINRNQDIAKLQFGQTLLGEISFDNLALTFDFDGNRLVNISDPTNPQDAATKAYVDSLSIGGSEYGNWQTISTATNLATNSRYLLDSSGGSFTVTLPASPTDNDAIILKDASDLGVNKVTVARNGNTIRNAADDLDLDVEHAMVHLLYYGGDWKMDFSVVDPDK